MFCYLVAPCYAQVYATLSYESWDISGRQKHKSERVVLDECDIETRVSVELDVGAVEEVKTCLVEAALCDVCQSMSSASSVSTTYS
jgi:hypothetical protein